jgi:hypothetical protein
VDGEALVLLDSTNVRGRAIPRARAAESSTLSEHAPADGRGEP